MKKFILLMGMLILMVFGLCLGDYDTAISYYARGINTEEALAMFQASQDMPLADLKIGECYFRLGQFDKAIPLLEDYLNNGPFVDDGALSFDDIVRITKHKVAHSYRMLGQLDKAKPWFKDFVINYPNDPLHENALESLTMCMVMGQDKYDKEELLALCDQFIQAYPNSDLMPWVTLRKAEVHEQMGDHENAQFYYDETVYLYPESLAAGEVLQRDVIKYFLNGKFAVVNDYLNTLSLDNGDNLFNYAYMKEVMHRSGYLPDSSIVDYISVYATYVENYPHHGSLGYAASKLYLDAYQKKDWINVIKYGSILLSTFDVGKEPLDLCYKLGEAYENTQQLQEALGMYQLFVLKASKLDARLEDVKAKIAILSPSNIISDTALRRIKGGCIRKKCKIIEGYVFGCSKVGDCDLGECEGQMCGGEYPACAFCHAGCSCKNCQQDCSGVTVSACNHNLSYDCDSANNPCMCGLRYCACITFGSSDHCDIGLSSVDVLCSDGDGSIQGCSWR